MDPMSEEQLDYGEEDYGGSQKYPFAGGGGGTGGAIPALADEELMGEDDEYDDLYNDVNVGEGFIQTLQQQQAPPARSEPTAPAVAFGNGNQNPDKHGSAGVEVKDSKPEQKPAQMGNMEFQGGSLASIPPKMGIDPNFGVGVPSVAAVAPLPPPLPPSVPLNPAGAGVVGSRPSMVNDNARQVMPPVDNSGPTMLFVGDLHWWTTDAELESVMSQYGRVKEIKFFDERASGKSKGYCQVEFYESVAAAACKEGMNGYLFNGKPCVVTFASPQTLKQMASGYMNKNQGQGQTQMQGRRGMNDGVGRGGGMGFQGGDGGRNFGRGGWGGRGGQGMLNRGQGGGGPMRGRGLMGGKGMVGAAGVVGGAAGGPYGQGLAGPGLAGPAGGMMHPQGMMGAGFDPTFMGRGGPYAGFAAPAFPGMMPSFQAVNAVGLPGVAPHVNPAFFGRGMSANGMGMMGGGSGMDGQTMGMWGDANMGGWTGEEHGRRTRESSYGGDDVGSEYGYGEVNHERGGRSNASREKERGSERDWSGNSERRNRDEREQDWDRSDRDRYKEEKDPYRDHRHRDRDRDNDDDWDRGQSSSRSRSKSRMMQEEDYRSRSRDADYGKRRRGSE